MRRLIWSDSSIEDLVRLREFIAEHNEQAAHKAALTIKDAAQTIKKHPLIGRPCVDLPNFHDLKIRFGASGYVLRYRLSEDYIYIIHIKHYRELDFH